MGTGLRDQRPPPLETRGGLCQDDTDGDDDDDGSTYVSDDDSASTSTGCSTRTGERLGGDDGSDSHSDSEGSCSEDVDDGEGRGKPGAARGGAARTNAGCTPKPHRAVRFEGQATGPAPTPVRTTAVLTGASRPGLGPVHALQSHAVDPDAMQRVVLYVLLLGAGEGGGLIG